MLIILLLIIVIGAVIFYFYSTVVEPETQPSPEPTTNLPPAAPTEEEACKATGGVWKKGFGPNFICVHSYPDGGKPCSSSDECESKRCLTKNYDDRISYCDYDSSSIGCSQTIEEFRTGIPGVCNG